MYLPRFGHVPDKGRHSSERTKAIGTGHLRDKKQTYTQNKLGKTSGTEYFIRLNQWRREV